MNPDQPYPDMTDDKVLSTLLSSSISFLEVKEPITAEKVKEWGDTLYDVYKYLVDRLETPEGAREPETPPGPQEETEIPEAGEEARGEKGQVFVFRNCQFENLNINPPPG